MSAFTLLFAETMDLTLSLVLVSIDLSSLFVIGEVCLLNYVGEQKRACCYGAVVGNLNFSSWLSSQFYP